MVKYAGKLYKDNRSTEFVKLLPFSGCYLNFRGIFPEYTLCFLLQGRFPDYVPTVSFHTYGIVS